MAAKQTKSLLRIYLSSSDQDSNQPLYETIVDKANENGLDGATVLKGVLGYKAKKAEEGVDISETKEKFPIVIEIVDNHDKLTSFFEKIKPKLEGMKKGCLITLESLDILLYK